ncbi:hypothetical protein NON00_21605, partial [Roseomonas sp. GC11]
MRPLAARLRRWALRLLVLLVLLPVLLLVLLPGLVLGGANTAPGQRLIAGLATHFVPGLTLEGLHGPIPGAPGLERLTLADAAGPWLVVEGLRLDLDLRALLHREVLIEELSARRLTLLRLPENGPTPPEATAPRAGGPLPVLPELPVALRLARLEIARIDIPRDLVAATVEEHGPPFALSARGEAELAAAALRARLALRRLEAEGQLDLDLSLDPRARLQASLRAREPAGGVLATALGIPEAPAELSLALEGPASGAALRAAAAFGTAAGFTAAGTLALDAQGGGALALEGHLDAPAPLAPAPLRAVDFAFRARLPAGAQPELEALRLAIPAGAITARGSLAALEAEASLGPSAALGDLVPAGFGWEALSLTARIEAGERITAQLRPRGLVAPEPLSGALGPAPEADYQGTLFRIDSLTLRGEGARLEVSGSGWERLDLTARLDLPDLKKLHADLSGPALLRARVSGPAADPGLVLDLESPGLTAAGRRIEAPALQAEVPALSAWAGTLRLTGQAEGQPVALDLRAARQGETVRLEAGRLTFGPVRAEASGTLDTATTRFDGRLTAAAEDLAPLSALLGQPIAGGFRLEAALSPTPEGRQSFDARLETQRVTLAGQSYAAGMTLKGTDAALDWHMEGRLPQASLQGRGRFSRTEAGMRLDIAALEVAQGALGQGLGLRLAAPGAVLLPPSGAVEIPGLRLAARPAGNLTLSGRWGPERADLRLALAALPASVVNLFVPEPRLSGTVVGEARLSGPVAAPELAATLNGTGLRVEAPWSRGWPAATLRVQAQRSG